MSEIERDSTNDNVDELVAFRIGDQEYCMDIMLVREIRGWAPATPIPHAPDFVKGIINLRGAVVPIVDLSARLGLGAIEPEARNVIIVADVGQQFVGLLVDAVSDVMTIDKSNIQPTPDVACELAKVFVTGLITFEDRLIRILDANQIMPKAIQGEAA